MADAYDEAVADHEAVQFLAEWNAGCDDADVKRGRTMRKRFYDVGRAETLAWIERQRVEE